MKPNLNEIYGSLFFTRKELESVPKDSATSRQKTKAANIKMTLIFFNAIGFKKGKSSDVK